MTLTTSTPILSGETAVGTRTDSIPIPQPSNVSALLGTLKVGESIVLPRADRPSFYRRADHLRIRIKTRAIDGRTVRVWRIE
jgi:hypothetical protein